MSGAGAKLSRSEDVRPAAVLWLLLPSCLGVRLSNVRVTSKVPDPRPLLTCDDVEHLELNRIGGTSAGPGQALLDLRNARNVFVHGCVAHRKPQFSAESPAKDRKT